MAGKRYGVSIAGVLAGCNSDGGGIAKVCLWGARECTVMCNLCRIYQTQHMFSTT